MTIDFNQTIQAVEQLLQQEQNRTITGRGDIGISQIRRKEAMQHIIELESFVSDLRSRYHGLPDLPDERHMDWAEAILAMKNLCILVLDTTSIEGDIIRIHARTQDNSLFDWIVRPQRDLTANSAYTGIAWDEIKDAVTLAEAWPMIHDYLSGYFVVGFNLAWIEERLKENISYYGLKRLPFCGDCIMKKAKAYFGIGTYERGFTLANAVARIGKPFPYSPPLASDRAVGVLALLRAMSQGVMRAAATNEKPAPITTDTSLGDLDNHPF